MHHFWEEFIFVKIAIRKKFTKFEKTFTPAENGSKIHSRISPEIYCCCQIKSSYVVRRLVTLHDVYEANWNRQADTQDTWGGGRRGSAKSPSSTLFLKLALIHLFIVCVVYVKFLWGNSFKENITLITPSILITLYWYSAHTSIHSSNTNNAKLRVTNNRQSCPELYLLSNPYHNSNSMQPMVEVRHFSHRQPTPPHYHIPLFDF